jgi:glycopeptide antibiotics resistance protein
VFLAMFGNVMGGMLSHWLQNMNIDIPEEAWKAIEESMNMALSPFSIMISFMSSLVIDVIFGLLGGLIGYSVYKPKPQVMPPPPSPSPQV